MMRRVVVALVASLALGLGLPSEPAAACGAWASCTPGDDGGDDDTPDVRSDPTVVEHLTTPRRSCSVYANGTGMGSHCITPEAGTRETLRERFGGQHLQRCRYSPVPPGLETPPAPSRSDGTYRLQTCLNGIDFDTYAGGANRALGLAVVFVPDGTDISDHHNPLSDFLWHNSISGAQLPVPVLQPRPLQVPLVGAPTTFTFAWVDPTSSRRTRPVRQVEVGGLTLGAEPTTVLVDPQQDDLPARRCDAQTVDPSCTLVFPRSSASARAHATEPIPAGVVDAFHLRIEVEWTITYGESDLDHELGSGFTMRLRQPLPVQEVQAPNRPPSVLW